MAVIMVSSCLLGCECRYKGDGCKNEKILELAKEKGCMEEFELYNENAQFLYNPFYGNNVQLLLFPRGKKYFT